MIGKSLAIAIVLGIVFLGAIIKILVIVYKRKDRNVSKLQAKTAIERVIEIIQNAGNELRLVSGELCHATWDSPDVLKAMKTALDKGIKISIFAGPWLDIESRDILRWVLEEKASFYLVGAIRESNHVVASDTESVLYQEHYPAFRLWGEIKKDYWDRFQKKIEDKPLGVLDFWDNFRVSSEENSHFQERLGRQVSHRFTHSYMRLCTQTEIDNFLREMST